LATPREGKEMPFNCTEKCPNEAQYTTVLEKDNGTKITVCVSDDGGLRNARIGIIVGVVISVALIVAVVVIVYFYCRRKQAIVETEKMKTAARILGVDTELQPLQLSGIEPDTSLLRLTKESELQKGGMIGAGAFGTVYKGWWIPENENVKIPVAIKVLIEGNAGQNQEMIDEARIMASANHKYCVRILAICMTARMMIITQLMPFGCLRNYIQQQREHIGSKVLLNWCTQIARGMEYLESRGIVHRDLAARNILVQRPEHVRITDFGLAKLLNNNQENFTGTGEKMPIKWLALESI
jgi:L1 cell adhesion molecule